MAKYIPSIKKAVLPSDVTSEVEEFKGTEIIEHGLGTNNKYYLLLIIEEELEIIQYDVKDVPEESVEEFSQKLEDLKINWLK